MKLLAGLVLLVALTDARSVREGPCTSPKQFTGHIGVYMHNIQSGDDNAMAGDLYYDGINKRIRVDITYKGSPVKVIQLYNEGLQYVISGDYCKVSELHTPFQPVEVPSDAHLLEEGRIGTSTSGLNVRRYYGVKDGFTYLGTVTASECVFTSSIAFSPKAGIVYTSITNVALAVSEDAFDHPSSGCQHSRAGEGPGPKALPILKLF